MTAYRAQVTLERDSLLPEDRVVNTWHFLGGGDFLTESDLNAVEANLVEFYRAFDQLLGSTLSGAWSIKWYDLNSPEPRVPLRTTTPTPLTPNASNSLPAEVAVCLSFAGERISGQSQARRRGRLYIGPLDTTWLATPAAGAVRPTAAFLDLLRNTAVAEFPLAGIGAAAVRHAVFSPTEAAVLSPGPGQMEQAMTPVVEYSTDNAFDTQRRRGASPTSRTVTPAA